MCVEQYQIDSVDLMRQRWLLQHKIDQKGIYASTVRLDANCTSQNAH